MAIKTADRYTVRRVHVSKLPEMVENLVSLGMTYFIMGRNVDQSGMCSVYVFFDEAGMENYLTRLWGDKLTEVTGIIRDGEQENETARETLGKIRDACGFTRYPLVEHPLTEKPHE